ncbi:hypothetical protein EZS27_032365 [termite gut metagenome]|uniref:Integrase catalytic domain-containing protein n=1 Tax=termite gut metagenome TaxID=433724 RepID=A0A5J4Q8V9_9ZZZZ
MQYAYPAYTEIVRNEGMRISMTQNGDPLENALAERVNGILKQEWLYLHDFADIRALRAVLEPAIEFYNTWRPHASNNFLTPQQAERGQEILENRWKKKSWKARGDYPPQGEGLEANRT